MLVFSINYIDANKPSMGVFTITVLLIEGHESLLITLAMTLDFSSMQLGKEVYEVLMAFITQVSVVYMH